MAVAGMIAPVDSLACLPLGVGIGDAALTTLEVSENSADIL